MTKAQFTGLTPAERRVCDLMKDYMTNSEIGAKLFISQHTVRVHVMNVYRHYEVGCRIEFLRLFREKR